MKLRHINDMSLKIVFGGGVMELILLLHSNCFSQKCVMG